MNVEYYRIGDDGEVTTEFSLKVARLVRAGVPELEAMTQAATGHRGRELLWLDDCWRFAAQSGRASYLPRALRETFAEQFATHNYIDSPEFARAVDKRRQQKRDAGQHDYQALVESLSECYSEWAGS